VTVAIWSDVDPGIADLGGVSVLTTELVHVASIAAQAQTQLVGLHERLTGVQWSGSAANAFRDRIGKLPAHLDRLARSYQAASDGLTTYAATVADIADQFASAKSALIAAQADHDWAAGQLRGWTPPAPGAVNPFAEQVAQARSRVAGAQTTVDALSDRRRAADRSAAGALHDAHSLGMHNASGWSHVWHHVAHDVENWTDDIGHNIETDARFVAGIGEYYWHHPLALAEQIVSDAGVVLGSQLVVAAGTGEALGIALDATGVGAIAGVPINIAAAAIGAGGLFIAARSGEESIKTNADAINFAEQQTSDASQPGPDSSWADKETLDDHFTRHGKDFQATSAADYAAKATAFFQRGVRDGLPTKIGPDGTIRIYDPATNTFGSFGPDGITKTFYKPSSPTYWSRIKGVLQ
jgi:hypothetical protein